MIRTSRNIATGCRKGNSIIAVNIFMVQNYKNTVIFQNAVQGSDADPDAKQCIVVDDRIVGTQCA